VVSDFPGSPKLLKGALVVFESQKPGPPPRVIVFQYNPEQLTRSLAHRVAPPEPSNVGGAREDAFRVLGPPVETINLSIVLDAADQLEQPDQNPEVAANGLHPALAALELLLYPPSTQVLLNRNLAQAGRVQVCPADLPLTLLVWGKPRAVPVRLTSFSISEEAFDPALNPIRAKVDLGMRVLTYMELKEDTLGYGAYVAYQAQKEVLARLVRPGDAANAIRGLIPR
jgi:Contractile injection system tube protein